MRLPRDCNPSADGAIPLIALDALVKQLGYDASPHYCRVNASHRPETAHLFRTAETALPQIVTDDDDIGAAGSLLAF